MSDDLVNPASASVLLESLLTLGPSADGAVERDLRMAIGSLEAENARLRASGRKAIDAGETMIGTLRAERDAAESALAGAVNKTKDEICEALLVISDGWKQQGNTETATAVSNAAAFTCGLERTKRIGRAFVAQHGSK